MFPQNADSVCRDLILCLLKEYMSSGVASDVLCARLQRACPTLFLQHDVVVAKVSALVVQHLLVVEDVVDSRLRN